MFIQKYYPVAETIISQASPFGDKRQLVRGNPLKPHKEWKDVTYA